ncbi:MAG TPA: alpha-glucuronidase family glycosyl hydrolase [Chitinophagaceae bacterium]|jgi:alpha-glucuronidase|nr:alpha-glucuronidase family glycosyl hydrolase [Chitinophagaceae bacterium]
MKQICFIIYFILGAAIVNAEDGYRLWLRYDKIDNTSLLQQYRTNITGIQFITSSPILAVAKEELLKGLQGLLGKKIEDQKSITDKCVVVGTPSTSTIIQTFLSSSNFNLGKEGFTISTRKNNQRNIILIAANSDQGALYGVFQFLRLLQTQQSIEKISIINIPKIQNRILNHWDNLNRIVERGYAGASIWNWHLLPGYIDKRYIDYARANASIGINGTVLTNVNANAQVLTKQYLEKVAALANVFRPYGIKVYLTARFSAPIEIGELKTADPLDAEVQNWWKQKVDEIYNYVPDFGGFLVKANSEGQPGPQNYKRTHADGANMLADALAPHNGIVIWRAFVYDIAATQNNNIETQNIASLPYSPNDRFKQAYNEFKPLDGKFRKNVLIQVKNGPIDFQPREPFSPLFGAMPQTPLAMEFQITQEYLGQATNLVYEAPLFKECLDADTYAKGRGPSVAKIIDGSLENYSVTGMAGVANIGNERNWTGHPFAQANWYAFGRLAWDQDLSSSQIADEWLRQTFTNDLRFIDAAKKIMLMSREALVNYMTPLGLHHIMGTGHHYGPAPWVSNAGRADWNPVYYHRADSIGIGFDRTAAGSNALSQYANEVKSQWENISTCDEKYLLWFHHVSWSYKMRSGRILWEELCHQYYSGVDSVRWMQKTWNELKNYIDKERFDQVKMLLAIQEKEAVWWRNACLLYFQTFSKMPIPANYEKPDHELEYYKALRFTFAPGNGGL